MKTSDTYSCDAKKPAVIYEKTSCPLLQKAEMLEKTALEMRRILENAFPISEDGLPDISGHRTYHETLIERNKLRIEFWRRMTFELTKYGLIVFLAWSGWQLWVAFLRGPIK